MQEVLPTILLITTYIIIFILRIKLKIKRHTIIGLMLFTTMSLMLPQAIPLEEEYSLIKIYSLSFLFSSLFSLFVYSHLLDIHERETKEKLEVKPKPN